MTDFFKSVLESRQFHLDEDKLPGGYSKVPPPHLSTGRQVVVNKHGRWVCASVQTHRHGARALLELAVANGDCTQGSEFPPQIHLLGQGVDPAKALFESQHPMPGHCALAIDPADRLTVFVEEESGITALSADASAERLHDALSRREAWSGPATVAPPGSKIGDVVIDWAGRWRLFYTQDKTLYELSSEAGAQPRKVFDQAIHPSVHIDGRGQWHLALERDRILFYSTRAGEGAWSEPRLAAQFCASWPCIATTSQGQVVIVYQGEGKADLRRFPALYSQLRDAGGTTISYAILKDNRWTQHDLVRSKNIVLRRRTTGSLLANRAAHDLARLEEFWRPGLAIDKHGVLWLFYSNTTRRHIYWSRFQGDRFGTPHEARGAFDAPSRYCYVQKESRGHGRIGYMTAACDSVYFDAIDVPDYASTQPRKIVFLDNLELDQMVGLEQCLGQWQRHPEPLWGWGISGNTVGDNITWCHVTKVDGGFAMMYNAFGEHRSNMLPGRAFSKDGLHWEKREPADWEAVTLDGKKDFSNFWRPLYLEDKEEKDPRHRYKGLLGHYDYAPVELRKYIVVTSPDTVHWTRWTGGDPVAMGDIAVPHQLVRDDEDPNPNRRYKFIGLMGSHSGRSIVIFTSPDLVHWSKVNFLREDPDDPASPVALHPTGPIAIDPDGTENPYEEEVHDAYIWRENGILMFHYDAFRFHANQHIEKALAVSRDGRHYWRIKRGQLNMPGGAVGSWDSGRDRTGIPIRVGDELWIYFCGMPASHYTDADDPPATFAGARPGPNSPEEAARHMVQRPWRVGLAKLRVDGWGYVQLQRDAREGQVTTIPFDYRGGQLIVNGSGLVAGGIQAEIRTADGAKAVPGFEGAKSRFSQPDAVRSAVTWTGAPQLTPGRYRLRFDFHDLRARLYAFGFEQASR